MKHKLTEHEHMLRKMSVVSSGLDQTHTSGINVCTLRYEIHTLRYAETHSVDQFLRLLGKLHIKTLLANKQLQQVSS